MPKYLVIYKAQVSAASQMANATPDQAKAGMEAWMRWAKNAGGSILDLGNPVGDPVRLDGGGGSVDSQIAGFSVLQAESKQALKALFKDHPHLMMPGASIEAYEFLPMPGM